MRNTRNYRGRSAEKRVEHRVHASFKYTLTRWILPAYIVGTSLVSIISILLFS